MDFIIAAHTDAGIKKETNQDSLLAEVADTDYGRVCLAVICDGMGGLAKGELASAALIRDIQNWFHEEFPAMLYQGIAPEGLNMRWNQLLIDANVKITNYGIEQKVKLGTTAVLLLIVGGMYYLIHVGDSRAYRIQDTVFQLTKDHTFVQREMDAGRMTPEQAKADPQRNVLLQCIGASSVIEPDFQFGEVQPGTCFLLCSDGFRHVISQEEIYEHTNPAAAVNESVMTEHLRYLTELDKYRREKDNISSVLIRTV